MGAKLTEKKTFAERLRAASPAHPEETKDYRKFSNAFSLISLAIAISAAYALWFLPDLEVVAANLDSYLPILNERLSFLLDNDFDSYLAYSATVLSVLVSVPVTVTGFSFGYWRTVAAPRKCRRVSKDTLLAILFGVSTSTILMAIAFIDVPETYDPRWPGFALILFWPIFPALGGAAAWFFGMTVFLTLVGMVKAACQYGGKYGG